MPIPSLASALHLTLHCSLLLHSLDVVVAAAVHGAVDDVVVAALVIEPIESTLVHEDRAKAQQDVVVVDDDGEHFHGHDYKRVSASLLLQEEDT